MFSLEKKTPFLNPEETGEMFWEKSQAVVVPFGLEASVSYGGGTKNGPEAILKASHQLELFDEEFWQEPYLNYGIVTLKKFGIKKSPKKAVAQLQKITAKILEANKFPLILGGEHSLTPGAVYACAEKFGKITILHFDAHADLRDGYEGEKFSHAAAMRRCLDDPRVNIVSVGIRSISAGEIPFLEANSKRVKIFWGKDKGSWQIPEILKALGNNQIYLSFDIDGLDSSIIPATGTPVPGGLLFDEATAIICEVAKEKKIIGADIVEFAPIKNLHACNFMTATLTYKILSYALSKDLRNKLLKAAKAREAGNYKIKI